MFCSCERDGFVRLLSLLFNWKNYMTTENTIKIVLPLALLAMSILVLMTALANAASMSAGLTGPTVDGEDIANYGTVTGTDKWWNDIGSEGQTFTTSSEAVWLNSLSYQITSTQKAEPTKNYVIRVGTAYGLTFTGIYSETATQTFTWNSSEYMTWTLDSPVLLAPNTRYGIDVGMTTSTSDWTTGIPYINRTADDYAGGTRYLSGTTGGIGNETMHNMSGDRIFHLDLSIADPNMPGYAWPQNGATVPSGDVELNWTNLPANTGSDVYVDVCFGSDPVTDFSKVVNAGQNTTSVTVSVAIDGRYYWQVNSYLDGSPTGDPVAGTLFTFYVDESSEAQLVAILTALKNHILNSPALTSTEIAAHKATIDTHKALFSGSYAVMEAGFDLVETYDTTPGFGPLWINRGNFNRNSVVTDIHWTIYNVMQYIMDESYTVENVTSYENLFDGFKFECSSYFPGEVDPPADPEVTHTATIDASYLEVWGHNTMYTLSPARKPTGTYLAPGSIVTITVPQSIVAKSYTVRVGTHSWDNSNRPIMRRLDRSSIVYRIDSTEVKVASPLGGSIYIEVPYLSDVGIIDVDIKNAVRSPFFSAKSFHATNLAEWQNTERHHPGPWADFQSEKFMMTLPTIWIYNFDDPVTLMADWNKAMDAMNDLMGYPSQNKETMYPQVDLQNRSSVLAPGYPSCNASYNPNGNYNDGNANNYFLKGPQYAPDFLFHEEGHGYLFVKFPGEMESTVNLLHVPVWHRKFGYDLDYAFAASRGYHGNPNRTLDNTAVAWMTSFNFSPREVPMHTAEKAYQLKGHAKFVDIARLFGWEGLNAFWYSINVDYENGIIWSKHGSDIDDLILRWSQSVGVDLRPLFHFWGTHPVNPGALEAAIEAENLLPSVEIYNLLNRYKILVPADNAAFQTFAFNWWGHEPSINGFWTETEHARQWDTQIRREQDALDQQRPNGEIYVEDSAAEIRAVIDGLLDLYFPDGTPGYSVELDNMVSWTDQPTELHPNIINNTGNPLTYQWTASLSTGIAFDPNEFVEAPTVTITKPQGDPVTFTLELTIRDEENRPAKDTMTIKVYDDPCKATRLGMSLAADNPTDINGDCITNLEDIAEMAANWFNDTSLTEPFVKPLNDTLPLDVTLDIDKNWMYQNLPAQTASNLTVTVSVTDDPSSNSSYSYQWEIILPSDVNIEPVTLSGGGSGDQSWTFAAPGCDEPTGISDLGETFQVKVTVTGNDYDNTGSAQLQFGIALLGDVNNDRLVDLADRSIINAFWSNGSAGSFTFRDCDVNCDGLIDLADRSITNAIWGGTLGSNSITNPCPLR